MTHPLVALASSSVDDARFYADQKLRCAAAYRLADEPIERREAWVEALTERDHEAMSWIDAARALVAWAQGKAG